MLEGISSRDCLGLRPFRRRRSSAGAWCNIGRIISSGGGNISSPPPGAHCSPAATDPQAPKGAAIGPIRSFIRAAGVRFWDYIMLRGGGVGRRVGVHAAAVLH